MRGVLIESNRPTKTALAAGVQAYLTKDVLHDELLKAIRAVHAGQTYLSGTEAAAAIRKEHPHARMIALTTYGGDEDIRRALAAGVLWC